MTSLGGGEVVGIYGAHIDLDTCYIFRFRVRGIRQYHAFLTSLEGPEVVGIYGAYIDLDMRYIFLEHCGAIGPVVYEIRTNLELNWIFDHF